MCPDPIEIFHLQMIEDPNPCSQRSSGFLEMLWQDRFEQSFESALDPLEQEEKARYLTHQIPRRHIQEPQHA